MFHVRWHKNVTCATRAGYRIRSEDGYPAASGVCCPPILVLHGLVAPAEAMRRLGVNNVLPKLFTRKGLTSAVPALLAEE